MSVSGTSANCPLAATFAGSLLGSSPGPQPPACDFAEARVWAMLGGGWECLHGCYCQRGISVEWHDFECAKPRDWARSFHPGSVEVCLNISGHARLSRDDVTAVFTPMSLGFYFVERERLAAWRLPGERHQFLTVEFSPGFLERHLKGHELALHRVLRSALRPEEVGAGLSSIAPLPAALRKWIGTVRQPEVAGAAQGLWYESKALELMTWLFFLRPDEDAPLSTRRDSVATARVARLVEILGETLAEPPSLKELGRRIGCSPYHLSRTFSREMGMTLPQYLRQIRMERAAELLKSGKFNVTEAALEVGYSSLSHFSHAFCEVMGCCPGLYPLGLVSARSGPLPAPATCPTAIRRQ